MPSLSDILTVGTQAGGLGATIGSFLENLRASGIGWLSSLPGAQPGTRKPWEPAAAPLSETLQRYPDVARSAAEGSQYSNIPWDAWYEEQERARNAQRDILNQIRSFAENSPVKGMAEDVGAWRAGLPDRIGGQQERAINGYNQRIAKNDARADEFRTQADDLRGRAMSSAEWLDAKLRKRAETGSAGMEDRVRTMMSHAVNQSVASGQYANRGVEETIASRNLSPAAAQALQEQQNQQSRSLATQQAADIAEFGATQDDAVRQTALELMARMSGSGGTYDTIANMITRLAGPETTLLGMSNQLVNEREKLVSDLDKLREVMMPTLYQTEAGLWDQYQQPVIGADLNLAQLENPIDVREVGMWLDLLNANNTAARMGSAANNATSMANFGTGLLDQYNAQVSAEQMAAAMESDNEWLMPTLLGAGGLAAGMLLPALFPTALSGVGGTTGSHLASGILMGA